MKKRNTLLSFSLILAFFWISEAIALLPPTLPTQLSPGDISFVQVNYEKMSFDFVLLKDITTGTQIKFTDQSYTSANGLKNQFLQPTTSATSSYHDYEIIATYTATENVAAGTVIQSKDNANFDVSDFDFASHLYNDDVYNGETILAFQVNGADTTYISAIGWMSANNFKVSSSPGTSEIPPGLSFENNTAVQLDSISSNVSHILQRNYKYYTGYGTEGSAYYLRTLFANSSHFQTYQTSNTIVSGPFTVLPDDTTPPELVSSIPADNTTGVSIHSDATFTFNEVINIKKSATLVNSTTTNTVATFAVSDMSILDDNKIWISMEGHLANNTSYYIEFPKDFLIDNDGNYWPSEATQISFTTGAVKNSILLDFNNEDIKDLTWHKQSDEVTGTQHAEAGYFTFSEKGIPGRKWTTFFYYDGDSYIEDYELNGAIDMTGGRSESSIDLSNISSRVAMLKARVMTNYTPLTFKVYYGGIVTQSQEVDNTMESSRSEDMGPYINMNFSIGAGSGVDSVVIHTLEGALLQLLVEFSDASAPSVDLGEDQIVCDGDSVQLGITKAFGESLLWSTGATSDSIWVKTSGTYNLTVSNSLGNAQDQVEVTVRDPLVAPFNGTKKTACLGDSVELIAGSDDLIYTWEDIEGDINIRKVDTAGWFFVEISNGYCSIKDSVEVEIQAASLSISMHPGGMWGCDDVEGQLFKLNDDGKYTIYNTQLVMCDYINYPMLPAGSYIFKAHFVSFSHIGENPFLDTYHDESVVWGDVTPIVLTCTSEEFKFFLMQEKPTTETGSVTIEGNINLADDTKSVSVSSSELINIQLYNADTVLIATQSASGTGNYQFTNLPSGVYFVNADRPGYTPTTPFRVDASSGSEFSNYDFTFNPATQTVTRSLAVAIAQVSGTTNAIKAVPNPASNYIQLQGFSKTADIDIYNLNGKLVRQYKSISANENIVLTNLNKGMYLLQVKTETSIQTMQIVIKR